VAICRVPKDTLGVGCEACKPDSFDHNQAETYEPPSILSGNTNTVYTYDLEKKLTMVLRPDGSTVELTYDIAGRLSTLAHSIGTLTYGYDGAGRLVSIHAGTQSLGYTWDGMLLTSVSWSGEVTGSVEYAYDNEFRVTSETVNGANPITYTYDDDGLVTGVGAMTITRDPRHGLVTGSRPIRTPTTSTARS
jgi:YD repeat-containing protein